VDPFVDLDPDRMVSRNHALLRFAGDAWWIEDQQSEWGTRVDGENIKGNASATPLKAWADVQFGLTVLTLVPPHGHRLRHGALVFDLDVSPTFNLSLVHTGVPLISRLVVRNEGTQPSSPAVLHAELPTFGKTEAIPIPPIPPGERYTLPEVFMQVEHRNLEARTAAQRRTLVVKLDGQILQGATIPCQVLPHNEWSLVPLYRHRLSLAAFVQPNHPLITLFKAKACHDLPARPTAEAALRAVYDHLYDPWHIAYRLEPVNAERPGQLVRLPHDVLHDVRRQQGEGTCLDLALLIAACLEALHQRPMIAFLDVGSHWHVLIGCWKRPGLSLDPLLFNLRDPMSGVNLVNDVVWVDPNGCTRNKKYREAYPPICEMAGQQLVDEAKPFLFALDVAAARTLEVAPLPFAGTPQWSDEASAALSVAGEAARRYRRRPNSVLLLFGLLSLPCGSTQQLLTKLNLPPEAALERLEAFIRHLLPEGNPEARSRHLMQAEENAPLLARRDGSPVILDVHLLRALLDTRAEALEEALQATGTSWDALDRMTGRGGDTLFETTFFVR